LALPQTPKIETSAPLPAAVDDEEDDDDNMEMPPISEILRDIPAPDPSFAANAPRMRLGASVSSVEQKPSAEDISSIAQPDAEPPLPEATSALPSEVPSTDPGLTRRSIFSQESSGPIPAAGVRSNAQSPNDALISRAKSLPRPTAEQLGDTPLSNALARPETPVRIPLPGELDATLPHSMAGFSRPGTDDGHIVLEPASAGVYHLTYACLLVPRFASHFLTGDIADKLSEWLPIISVAFGWRLEYLAVRPDYLQWVANVPPATSPGYLMRVMRQQVSDKIFTAFPRLKKDNPSGDFWAPGYLIMGGMQPHPPQLVKDYIKQVRQRQGVEKPHR